jgi:hypothetical protein
VWQGAVVGMKQMSINVINVVVAALEEAKIAHAFDEAKKVVTPEASPEKKNPLETVCGEECDDAEDQH